MNNKNDNIYKSKAQEIIDTYRVAANIKEYHIKKK